MSTTQPSRVLGRDRAVAVGEAIDFGLATTRGAASRRVTHYLGEVLRQAAILAAGSTVVIVGLVLALGLVVGIEAAYGARQVGAPSAAGAFTAIGDLREIGPYAFAYMMAAKVGTGYVAELGTMSISEEIDALRAMGIDSRLYLCSTRLLACWLVIPFMFGLAMAVGFLGSYISVVVQIGQVSSGGYLELFWKFSSTSDYLYAFTKTMAMSTFVVLVGLFYGFTVRGGPVEVGRATARSMMVNLVGIHVIGILGSQIFWGGIPRLPIGG